MALISFRNSYSQFLSILKENSNRVSPEIIEAFQKIFKTPLSIPIMPNKKYYVEFDSSFRNRNLYPLPSTFVVEISQTAQGDRFTAKDPVCDSSPVLIWSTTFVEGGLANTITGITVSPTVLPSLQGTTKFKISTVAPNNLRQVRNYYVGATLRLATPSTVRRIVEYLPLNNNNAIVTLDSALPDSVIGLGGFSINNPTPLATNTANSVIKVFIPGSNDNLSATEREQTYGLGGDNYYVGYYIFDGSNYPQITAFDATTRLATLSGPTGLVNWAANGVSINLEIRKKLPFLCTINVLLSTSQFTILPNIVVPNIGSQTASTIDDFYVGSFFRIPARGATAISPYPPSFTESRRIVSYVASTRTITVSPAFSAPIPEVTVSKEILPFTLDSATQFNFTGPLSTAEQNETYEVELLNLVLPNTLLKSGRGGRAIFYPYFYVELRQLSTGTTQSFNVIYSNNPNSYRMLFRAVVDDNAVPVVSPFVKIDGDGMTHTIKIKPNDTFRFSVFHPNGELFQTEIQDTFNPTFPNPLAQISACFCFKKIN